MTELIHLMMENLYPLISISPFLNPSASSNYHSTLLLWFLVLAFIFFLLFFLLFFSFVSMSAPVAHGSSQARGQIRAVPEAYTTAMATSDPSHICNLCHNLQQCQILNPQWHSGSSEFGPFLIIKPHLNVEALSIEKIQENIPQLSPT